MPSPSVGKKMHVTITIITSTRLQCKHHTYLPTNESQDKTTSTSMPKTVRIIQYGSMNILQEDNAKLVKENPYPTIDYREFFLTPTCKTIEHFQTWMHCNVTFGGAANVLQAYLTDNRYY